MEYKEFAKYYDTLYRNKDYEKEVIFLSNFLLSSSKILDVGCGTGRHASFLEELGHNVDGVDLNSEMLEIAKNRIKGNLYNQNILDLNINLKYDFIIAMFAVVNHLHNLKELEIVFKNLKDLLNDNGKILIDLHNPQSSGQKIDIYNDIKRTMKWFYDFDTKIENSEITFEIGDLTYVDKHTFRIFSIEEIKKVSEKCGLKVINVYQNYDINKKGEYNSKNLQFLIEKTYI